MRILDYENLLDILYGCAILGTGGGGSLDEGVALIREALAAGNALCVAAGKPLLDACGEELAEAENALRRLGARTEKLERFNVAEVERALIVIRKTGPTPKGYPRRFAKIKKDPL